MIINNGWLTDVKHRPSENHNHRPADASIDLVVVHNISLPPNEFGGEHIENFFQNQLDTAAHPYFETIKDMQVSAHLLIKRTGEVVQFVSFDDRAWHAGSSCYLGRAGCNDFSIGIELEGSDTQHFTSQQYQSLTDCISAINAAYPKTKNHIVGHSDVAAGRKTDPGPCFDWLKLRQMLAKNT